MHQTILEFSDEIIFLLECVLLLLDFALLLLDFRPHLINHKVNSIFVHNGKRLGIHADHLLWLVAETDNVLVKFFEKRILLYDTLDILRVV